VESDRQYFTGAISDLYLFSAYYQGGVFPEERGWNRNVMRDPRVRLKIGDRLFDQTVSHVTDPETGRQLILWQQTKVDNFNQVLSVRIIADKLDRNGSVGHRLYRDYQIRYAHRFELLHLIERCGYEVIDLYGNFEYSPFDEDSEEMVWVLRLRD